MTADLIFADHTHTTSESSQFGWKSGRPIGRVEPGRTSQRGVLSVWSATLPYAESSPKIEIGVERIETSETVRR
jgi:hypothetical protein